jgi:hypothetical protein
MPARKGQPEKNTTGVDTRKVIQRKKSRVAGAISLAVSR